MERRKFIKSLLGLCAVAITAPKVLMAKASTVKIEGEQLTPSVIINGKKLPMKPGSFNYGASDGGYYMSKEESRALMSEVFKHTSPNR